ncbi:AAA family ATPase [Methanothrix harundinacea]|uniref:Signal recognition particle GTPase n=1 Tax=Methanothrix harundinacea (strain 6Ac) TaxID=1110509 RepID=G7WQX3_METH6|nr:Signal recognition particle GTPase [Methanothrix harundinacea 6Ac]
MESMKAKSLSEIYDIFDPQEALSGETLKEYYVRRESPIDRHANALRSSGRPLKYLFVGSRGNGKSTELNRLSEILEDDLLIVPFSIRDKLNLYDIEYSDILLIIAAEIYERVSENVELSSKLSDYLDSWSEKVIENEKSYGLSAEAKAGFAAFVFNITGKMKTEASTREVTRKVIQPQLSDLIYAVNKIIIEAEEKLDKNILVIIDDLDKVNLEKGEELFYKHGAELTSPICRIIYTIPQPLLFSNKIRQIVLQYFDGRIDLGNINIYNRNGELDPEGCDLMKQVALKRMDESLISKDALNLAVKYSAGVMTEFIRIIRSAGNIADTDGRRSIELSDVEQAIADTKNDYIRILNPQDIEILKEVMKTKGKVGGEKFQDLLFSLAILEYSNGEAWYDIHPAIKRIIK